MTPKLPGYTISKLLGKGGSGEVYKAIKESTQQTVAIKILNGQGNIQRYKNEARIQSSINHPNIARLYDFIFHDNRFYLIMEYVSGITLTDLIEKSNNISEEKKHKLFGKVVEAVSFLHSKNIIHRDLKPANIKVTSEGEIKLIDFGIARGISTPDLTQQGYVVGTVSYSAPERMMGMSHKQSDIWSLGVIYYELLSGERFLEDCTTEEIVKKIKDKNYITNKISSLPRSNTKIIKKCLHPNWNSRYHDAGQLSRVLKFLKATSIFDLSKISIANRISIKWIIPIGVLVGLLLYTINPIGPARSKEILNASEVHLILHPKEATLDYEGIKYQSGDIITAEKGSQKKAYLSADGYKNKKVLIHHSNFKDRTSLEFTLYK